MSDFLTIAAIGLHMGSVHLPAEDYNNFNPGVYIVNEQGYVAGGFYNSHRRASFYVGRQLQLYGPVTVVVGGITGYDRAPVVPMLVPSVRLSEHFRLSVLPPVWGMSTTLHLSVEW